jgi:hypothetical protein
MLHRRFPQSAICRQAELIKIAARAERSDGKDLALDVADLGSAS